MVDAAASATSGGATEAEGAKKGARLGSGSSVGISQAENMMSDHQEYQSVLSFGLDLEWRSMI